jgi:hypothetical protein
MYTQKKQARAMKPKWIFFRNSVKARRSERASERYYVGISGMQRTSTRIGWRRIEFKEKTFRKLAAAVS